MTETRERKKRGEREREESERREKEREKRRRVNGIKRKLDGQVLLAKVQDCKARALKPSALHITSHPSFCLFPFFLHTAFLCLRPLQSRLCLVLDPMTGSRGEISPLVRVNPKHIHYS